MTTVLVTAAGGDLGQAVIKALRLGATADTIVGTDVETESAAPAFVDAFRPAPAASDPSYVDALDEIAADLGAAVVIPASEHELRRFDGRLARSGAVIVAQPRAALDVHLDKLASMRMLAPRVRLAPFADGASPTDVERLVEEAGFPLVVKPRRSSGSRQIRVVAHHDALREALSEVPEPIVQAHLDDAAGEFSVGVFRAGAFESAIAFRRELRSGVGLSWIAETAHDSDVEEYALAVARAAGLEGSSNVQLRVTAAGPRLLEVNPRFSSLVAARAAAGFADADWSVALALGRPLPKSPPAYRHLRFRRYYAELFDFGGGYGAVREFLPRGTAPSMQ